MARRVIKALDIGTSATHMEWFYGPKGLKFSEIGCRPPGVRPVGRVLRGERVRHLSRVGDGDRARSHRPAALAPLRRAA